MLSAIVFLAAAAALLRFDSSSSDVAATVTRNVLVEGTVPFGVNLGIWTFWGAEQLMSNILKNPGFEGLVDGAIVLPVHSQDGTFDDSPAWLARPDAFWAGARYSIRTGSNAGSAGEIVHSSAKNFFGLPSFTPDKSGPMPDPGEAVAISKVREDALPTQWVFSKEPSASFSPAPNQIRPGSPGSRSLRISARSSALAEVASYLDTIGDRAGKMLPLQGRWTLSFWARQDRGHASLKVVLGRDGSSPVLAYSPVLNAAWKQFRLSFDAGQDDGPPGAIGLRFQTAGEPDGDILLDDVDLHRDSDGDFPFRAEVVSTLQALHPSYLRDWQGQLGDTLANRIAPAFARKAWRYRPPGDEAQSDFGYGLGDFIALARRVGAAPWLVVPTVFSDEECAALGSWLAAPGRLEPGREVLLEFGNENWNALFRPAGIVDPSVHARAADRCFAALRGQAHGVNLKTVVNTKFADPRQVAADGRMSHAADIVAVAPYFAFSMPAGLSLNKRNALLFEPPDARIGREAGDVTGMRKELAAYEVNLHTVSGTASEAERVPVVAGLASGAALARTLLDGLARGLRRQCIYSFAGFDAGLETVKGRVPLWGIVRDLSAPGRFRPTGLALRLLNETVAGNMLQVDWNSSSGVSVYAFEARGRISVVIISESPERRQVSLQLPDPVHSNATLRVSSLMAVSPSSSNEESTGVTIGTSEISMQSRTATVVLEPWGMTILRTVGGE